MNIGKLTLAQNKYHRIIPTRSPEAPAWQQPSFHHPDQELQEGPSPFPASHVLLHSLLLQFLKMLTIKK
jgi:hypothetical protein